MKYTRGVKRGRLRAAAIGAMGETSNDVLEESLQFERMLNDCVSCEQADLTTVFRSSTEVRHEAENEV